MKYTLVTTFRQRCFQQHEACALDMSTNPLILKLSCLLSVRSTSEHAEFDSQTGAIPRLHTVHQHTEQSRQQQSILICSLQPSEQRP